MVKTPPGQFLLPARGMRNRGRGYTTERNGQLFWSSSPVRKVGAFSQEELDRQAYFKALVVAAGIMSAGQQEAARRYSKRTTFAVRDLLMMTLANTLVSYRRPNGTMVYSPQAQGNTSAILDTIGQTDGDIMWRRNGLWVPLSIGAPLEKLGVSADGESIEWQAGGGGSAALVTTVYRTSDDTASASWPRDVPWQASSEEGWGGAWDISAPATINLPSGISQVRAFGCVRVTNAAAAGLMAVQLAPLTGAFAQNLGPAGTWPMGTGFGVQWISFTTPWIPVGTASAVALRLQNSAGASRRFDALSACSVEIR